MQKTILIAAVAALGLAAVSCHKLEPQANPEQRTVTLDAIPQDMGELFAVTSAPNWPTSAQLWFQKPDKTITMVAVDMKGLRLSGTVVNIPRR